MIFFNIYIIILREMKKMSNEEINKVLNKMIYNTKKASIALRINGLIIDKNIRK